MVGVPGRSKGCNTCLKRKIKCDEGKPTCGNCVKSKRACGGYVRKRIYVFSDAVTLDKSNVAKLDKGRGTLTFQGRWRAYEQPRNPLIGSARGWQNRVLGAPNLEQQLSIPPSCSDLAGDAPDAGVLAMLRTQRISHLPSVWQQMYHIFMSNYLPSGRWSPPHTKDLVTGNWMAQLHGQALDLPALRTSLAAYTAAQIGRQVGDQALVQQSRDMYLRSISQLRDAIGNRETIADEQTLAACMATSVYELTEGSSWKTSVTDGPAIACAYDTHVRGALMLLHVRGPDSNTTKLSHSLFLAVRRSVVLEALMYHRDIFLGGAEWHERPWSTYPKNRLDLCIDLIFLLPPIQLMWDAIVYEADERIILEKASAIISKVTRVSDELKQWYAEFEDSVPGPLYWPVLSGLPSKTDDELLGQVFPISFQFPTFAVAYLLVTYWGGRMISSKLLMRAYRKIASVPSCTDDNKAFCAELAATHEDIWIGAVRNLCQSTEAFIHPDGGQLGSLMALTSLKGCQGGLELDEDPAKVRRREAAWVDEILERIARRLNFL